MGRAAVARRESEYNESEQASGATVTGAARAASLSRDREDLTAPGRQLIDLIGEANAASTQAMTSRDTEQARALSSRAADTRSVAQVIYASLSPAEQARVLPHLGGDETTALTSPFGLGFDASIFEPRAASDSVGAARADTPAPTPRVDVGGDLTAESGELRIDPRAAGSARALLENVGAEGVIRLARAKGLTMPSWRDAARGAIESYRNVRRGSPASFVGRQGPLSILDLGVIAPAIDVASTGEVQPETRQAAASILGTTGLGYLLGGPPGAGGAALAQTGVGLLPSFPTYDPYATEPGQSSISMVPGYEAVLNTGERLRRAGQGAITSARDIIRGFLTPSGE